MKKLLCVLTILFVLATVAQAHHQPQLKVFAVQNYGQQFNGCQQQGFQGYQFQEVQEEYYVPQPQPVKFFKVKKFNGHAQNLKFQKAQKFNGYAQGFQGYGQPVLNFNAGPKVIQQTTEERKGLLGLKGKKTTTTTIVN